MDMPLPYSLEYKNYITQNKDYIIALRDF